MKAPEGALRRETFAPPGADVGRSQRRKESFGLLIRSRFDGAAMWSQDHEPVLAAVVVEALSAIRTPSRFRVAHFGVWHTHFDVHVEGVACRSKSSRPTPVPAHPYGGGRRLRPGFESRVDGVRLRRAADADSTTGHAAHFVKTIGIERQQCSALPKNDFLIVEGLSHHAYRTLAECPAHHLPRLPPLQLVCRPAKRPLSWAACSCPAAL